MEFRRTLWPPPDPHWVPPVPDKHTPHRDTERHRHSHTQTCTHHTSQHTHSLQKHTAAYTDPDTHTRNYKQHLLTPPCVATLAHGQYSLAHTVTCSPIYYTPAAFTCMHLHPTPHLTPPHMGSPHLTQGTHQPTSKHIAAYPHRGISWALTKLTTCQDYFSCSQPPCTNSRCSRESTPITGRPEPSASHHHQSREQTPNWRLPGQLLKV